MELIQREKGSPRDGNISRMNITSLECSERSEAVKRRWNWALYIHILKDGGGKRWKDENPPTWNRGGADDPKNEEAITPGA